MRIWIVLNLLILLILTACAPSNVTPTPTIVRLDRSALTPTLPLEAVADAPATATPIPFPSVTPTPTPFSSALLTTPTPIAEVPAETINPTAGVSTPQVEIITAGLNVRQGPGVNYPAIATVAQGDVLNVTGISANRNWLQIVTPKGQPGWISAQPEFTRLTGSLDEVPVVNSAAGPEVGSPSGGQRATKNAGRLVFMTGSGGDLYAINSDGTNLRHLASGVIDPVVSPDGRQVAFTRWDGAEFGTLYVLNLDGSGERAILSETRQAKSPAWSPDGQEIIVSFQHGGLRDPSPECRTFDVDDGFQLPGNIKITKTHVGVNGVTVCFVRLEDLQWSLRRVNVATGKFEDMPADTYTYNPAWDPTNPWRVIYDGDKGLMQLDVTNGSRQPITTDLRDTGPVFSPDGAQLALTYKQHDHWEVYTYDLKTGARRRLTKPPILADPQYNSAAPAWSPDGTQLAFVTDRSGKWEIWVMNPDGSNQHPLFAPEVQAQLGLAYHGVNERMLNWIR
ncbi:MAG: PD40 domain-containing protein [Anaerolineales bacterium]|nr:PD40 domain-containing protein [Anaerolineales bacterium]